ncbi:hypothetical protein HY497_00150 [Candidatus Woesearchaeota archaeon]|nr:hypothetical protein [Candidatus Woesearchaeota archaeon]
MSYHSEEDQRMLQKRLHEHFKHHPDFLIATLAEYPTHAKKAIVAIKKLVSQDFSSFTNQELCALFEQARKQLVYNCFMDHYDYFLERYFTPLIEAWVSQRLPDAGTERVSEVTALLVRPQKVSPYYKERSAFFSIVEEIKKNQPLATAISNGATEAILDKFPKIQKALMHHIEQYKHIRVVVNAEPMSMDDLWKEICTIVANGQPMLVTETRPGDNYDKECIAQARELQKQLKPDKRTLKLITGVRQAIYLRLLDNEFQGRTTVLLRPLYDEVAHRIGITQKQLKHFVDEEITQYLMLGKKIPDSVLKMRAQPYCYIMFHGKHELLIGKDAQAFIRIVQGKSAQEEDQWVGTGASKGCIQGPVRVVRSHKEAEELKEGEILITPSAGAYFVPIMHRARAIVTEFGGITNHAVIVARERRFPCVVGIKGITLKLHTGDNVEVDGTNGIVRKVKK